MKKFTQLLLSLAIIMAFESGIYAQALSEYCEKTVTHFNIAAETASAIKLTISKVDASSMYVLIESADSDPVDLLIVNGGSGATISDEDKSVTGKIKRTLTFSGTPPTDVSIELLWSKVSMGGNWMLNTFSVPFDASCNVVITDTEVPVMVSATVSGTPAFNSVNLLLSATDNVTSPVTKFIANDASNGITNLAITADASGNATINGLSPATTYNLVITAKDGANNISTTSATASFTTATRVSECSGDRGHFGNPTVTRIHHVISYLGSSVIYTITPIESGRTIDFAEVQTTSGNYAMTIATDGLSATYTQTGLTAGQSVGIRFMYSLDNIGGNEMTSENLTLNDANIIFYIVGDCSEVDSEAPTAFTATKGNVTYNSVELLLNATDNLGTIAYEITYGSTTLTTSGTSGVEKSYIVTGLSSATEYTFSVIAKDVAGNAAANNPIEITATTTTLAEPTTAAPTPPTFAAGKVISIFSDAYTNVAGTNLNPNWGQNTVVSTIQIESNNTLKYTNLNYQGTEFGSDVNAVTMNYLHVDVWTPNETSLNFYLISRTTGEKFISLTPLNLNGWNSYDIPLTDFTSQSLSVGDLFQFKIVGSGGKIIYLDNMYFYNNSTDVDTEVPTGFTASAGTKTYNSIELLLNATDNSGAVSYDITYGSATLATSGVSGTQKSFVVTGLTPSTEYTFSITAKDVTGNQAANSPLSVTASTIAAPAAPTTAAPIPTVNASKVISIFSDTYTSGISGANFNPNWSQTTVYSLYDISGNSVIKLENFNYQGFEYSTVDASTMTKLHIDVWTPNETSLQVTPLSPSQEHLVSVGSLNLETWNSFDIPLSSFTGVSLSSLFQFKMVGSGGKIVYIDNIYLYNDNSNDVTNIEDKATISCYPNPVLDRITVSSKTEINSVEVRNILGQTLKVVKVNSLETNIDLSSLHAGNYFVTVKMTNGKISTQKVIKF